MARFFLRMLSAFLCLIPAGAQAITLGEAVNRAVQASESGEIVREGAVSQKAGARASVAELLPQLKLEADYLEMGTNAEPNPYFVTPDRDVSATLSAAQLLWAGGRITKGFKLKNTLYDEARTGERMGLASIRYKVAAMYYGVLFERARTVVLSDRVNQREQELGDARALLDSGLAAPLDVRQASVSLNMAREALLSGELSYRQSLIDFNVELGNPAVDEASLLVPEGELGRAEGLGPELSAMGQGLSVTNAAEDGLLPELKLSELSLREAELRHGIAKGLYFPQLSLVASGTTSGEKTSEMDESWAAGLTLRFDFYDGGLRGAKRAGALAEKRKAERELSRTRKLIGGRVFSMRMRADAISERIALWEESVKMAADNYDDAREEYRAGLSTLTRLGEFGLSLAEARLSLLGLYLEEQKLMSEAGLLLGRTR